MNSASVLSVRRARARGFTLLETIVAIAVALVFFTGAVLAFAQMMRASDRSHARIEALSNARHALEDMSVELKRARLIPASIPSDESSTFTASRTEFPNGDRINDDLDATVDEEITDGADDDADWVIADDRHAAVQTTGGVLRERPRYYQSVDLGDVHLDQDVKFSSSTVSFETFPLSGQSSPRRVTYSLGPDPDGEPNNSLIKTTTFLAPDPGSGFMTTQTETAAIAHNVLSFAPLFYRSDETSASTGSGAGNPWSKTWPPADGTTTRSLVPDIPVSVYLNVSVYSGIPQNLSEIVAGQQYDAVSLRTIVDIEAVLADPRFTEIRRQDHIIAPQ